MVVWFGSHLELLIARPVVDSPFRPVTALLSTVRWSPPTHASSRYRTSRLDLTLDVTSWMARANEKGQGGFLAAQQCLRQERTFHFIFTLFPRCIFIETDKTLTGHFTMALEAESQSTDTFLTQCFAMALEAEPQGYRHLLDTIVD